MAHDYHIGQQVEVRCWHLSYATCEWEQGHWTVGTVVATDHDADGRCTRVGVKIHGGAASARPYATDPHGTEIRPLRTGNDDDRWRALRRYQDAETRIAKFLRSAPIERIEETVRRIEVIADEVIR